jgi:hypothetical protein
MAKTEVITAKETKYAETIEGFYLAAERNLFMVAKTLYELKRDNNSLYISVKKELDKRNVIPNTTVKELALIAECRDGFLIENQDKLPQTRFALYALAKVIRDDDGNYEKLKTVIKQKSLQNLSKNKVIEQVMVENKTSADIFESEVTQKEKKVNVIANEKSITINIPKEILNDEKRVMKDFKKIKEIMDYADIETHGTLEKFITGQDE